MVKFEIKFDLKIEHCILISRLRYTERDKDYIFEDLKLNIDSISKTLGDVNLRGKHYLKSIYDILIEDERCPDSIKAKLLLAGYEHNKDIIMLAKELEEAFMIILTSMSFKPGMYIRDDKLNWHLQE